MAFTTPLSGSTVVPPEQAFTTSHSGLTLVPPAESFTESHSGFTTPASVVGSTFDHDVITAPAWSSGVTSDAAVSAITTGNGPIFEHIVEAVPLTFSGAVSDEFVRHRLDDIVGAVFDHEVEAFPLADDYGPVYDTAIATLRVSAFGPISDAASVIPPFIDVIDPDTILSPGEAQRNRIVPQLVEFRSPNTYGLEKDPGTGRITGFKF